MALTISLCMPCFAAADTVDDGNDNGTGTQNEEVTTGGENSGEGSGTESEGDGTQTDAEAIADIDVVDMTPTKPSITGALDQLIFQVEGKTVKAEITYSKMVKRKRRKRGSSRKNTAHWQSRRCTDTIPSRELRATANMLTT